MLRTEVSIKIKRLEEDTVSKSKGKRGRGWMTDGGGVR